MFLATVLAVPGVAAAQTPFSASPATVAFAVQPGELAVRTITVTNVSGQTVRMEGIGLVAVVGGS